MLEGLLIKRQNNNSKPSSGSTPHFPNQPCPSERRESEGGSIKSSQSGAGKKRVVPKAFLSAMKGNLYNKVTGRGPEEPAVPGVGVRLLFAYYCVSNEGKGGGFPTLVLLLFLQCTLLKNLLGSRGSRISTDLLCASLQCKAAHNWEYQQDVIGIITSHQLLKYNHQLVRFGAGHPYRG